MEQKMLLLYYDAYTNNYPETQRIIVKYFKKLQTIKFKILLTTIMSKIFDNSYEKEISSLEEIINNMTQKMMLEFHLEHSKAQLIDATSKNSALTYKAIQYMNENKKIEQQEQ